MSACATAWEVERHGGNAMGGSVRIASAKPSFVGEMSFGYGNSINNQGLGGGGDWEREERIRRATKDCGVSIHTCPILKTRCGDPCAGMNLDDPYEFCCECAPAQCPSCEGGCSDEIGCCSVLTGTWHGMCGNPSSGEGPPVMPPPCPGCGGGGGNDRPWAPSVSVPRMPGAVGSAFGDIGLTTVFTLSTRYSSGTPTLLGSAVILGMYGPLATFAGPVFGNAWLPFIPVLPFPNPIIIVGGAPFELDDPTYSLMAGCLPIIIIIGVIIIIIGGCGPKKPKPKRPSERKPDGGKDMMSGEDMFEAWLEYQMVNPYDQVMKNCLEKVWHENSEADSSKEPRISRSEWLRQLRECLCEKLPGALVEELLKGLL